jgi:DNA repair protein RadC
MAPRKPADAAAPGDGAAPDESAAPGAVEPPPKPHYRGHRGRVQERLLNAGAGALQDYELLELLLAPGDPLGDTKPLAKALLDRFEGNLARAITAPLEELRKVSVEVEVRGKKRRKRLGDPAIAALKAAQALAHLLLRHEVKKEPVLSSWKQVIAYIRAAMAHERNEQFRILFLDKKNKLIGDEVQQRGTVDHAPVYPREVVKRALELGASALILVHNHPSGDPTPSAEDRAVTRQLVEAGRLLDLPVYDHIIVAGDRFTSFASAGLL